MNICFLYLIILFFNFGISTDSTRVKELIEAGDLIWQADMDSALAAYQQAADIAQETEYWIGAGRAMSYAGIVYNNYGLVDSAIVYHNKSIAFYEKANYKIGVASSMNNLGNAYQFLGDYQLSVNYYLKSIEIYEENNDFSRLVYAYGNIAGLFTDFDMFEKAREFQLKGLEYSYEIGDTHSAGYLLNDLSLTYLNLNDRESAFRNMESALLIAEEYNDVELQYYVNKNLYNYFLNEDDPFNAYEYALKTHKNAVATKQPFYEAFSLNALGLLHLHMDNPDSAYHYVNLAIEIAEMIPARRHLMDAYDTLSQIHSNQGRHNEAYSNLLLYNAYRDSVLGREQQEYITRLEKQYQVKNKDNEILRQQLAIETSEALLQKKRSQNSWYLIGLLTMSFLMFLLWYRHRQNQKLNTQRIQTLQKEQELTALAALIEGENMERKRIATDLHDSVNGSLASVKHNLSVITAGNFSGDDDAVVESAIRMIDGVCEQVRNISHNLIPPSLMNYGLVEALEQYCHRINSANSIKVTFQHYGEPLVLPKKAEAALYHIAQELITNSIKHSRCKSVLLQIYTEETVIQLTAEDDGIGYDTSAASHGLGLKNIKARVAYLKACMDVKSDGEGTSVNIEIDPNKIPLS